MRKRSKRDRRELARSLCFLRRLAGGVLAGYLVLTVLFYFLAGEQLHLRQSRGDLDLPAADSGTVELTAGSVVEQRFTAEIQRLEQIDVQWGTYYRANSGSVLVELYDGRDDTLLLSQSFEAETLMEGGVTTLTAQKPLEGLYEAPLLLRISSPDGQPGASASPLMSAADGAEGWALALNGESVAGTLCFAARGTDYIWTGLHYWEFVAAGFALLLAGFAVVWLRCRLGKHSYVLNAMVAIRQYRFLIRQLVSRDFKKKYKRSILGVFWSFLNPLLMMSVQYVVFSTIFRSDIENFAVYLLIGVVLFNFFSESCGMSLTAILGNASLITKVYVPKYIYPLTRVMSSVINLGISLIPLLLVSLLTGVRFQKAAVLSLYFLVCLILFSLGLSFLLSASMVFFRDTQFLWNVLQMAWMYATPIFYPETILPEQFRFVLRINPLYYFLKNTRLCLMGGISPEPAVYVQCLLIALVMLVVGSMIFKSIQDKFILYL